jgi:membrane protease YdiL (CAAX protease family)
MPGTAGAGPLSNGHTRAGIPSRPDLPRPRSTWRWWHALLVYVGALIIGGIVSAPILLLVHPQATAEMATLIASAAVELVILFLWFRRFHPGWRGCIGIPQRSRIAREWLGGVWRGALLFLAITYPVGLALTFLFTALTGRSITTPEQLPPGLDIAGKCLAAIYAVGVAPIVEETVFRGAVFRSLRDRHGFWPAALVSAVAFGLVHYVPAPFVDSLLLMVAMVFTGIGLAYIYDRRGNIVASIGAHMTFNAIAIVLIFALGR